MAQTLNEIIGQVAREAAAAGVREALGIEKATNRRLLSIRDAAEYLDCSESTVYGLIHDGELKIIKRGDRTKLDIRDLDHWIESKKQVGL